MFYGRWGNKGNRDKSHDNILREMSWDDTCNTLTLTLVLGTKVLSTAGEITSLAVKENGQLISNGGKVLQVWEWEQRKCDQWVESQLIEIPSRYTGDDPVDPFYDGSLNARRFNLYLGEGKIAATRLKQFLITVADCFISFT